MTRALDIAGGIVRIVVLMLVVIPWLARELVWWCVNRGKPTVKRGNHNVEK